MINHCDRRIAHLIMICLWLYCISITKMSDMSITVIYHGMSLAVLYQYHYEEWYVYHSDLSWYVSDYCISITKMSDTSITVIYHDMSLAVLYQYHYEEWYVYHSDLSWYVSGCTVSVSLWRVIRLSQDVSLFIVILIQYSQRHTMINHCDRRITLHSDTDTVQPETYHDKSLW
jgi:hypothetical protein